MLDLLVGAAVTVPCALLARRVGRVSANGAIAGVVCGAVIYAAFYLGGLGVLGVALLLTIGASRASATRTPVDPADDDNQRGARNIIANCGLGALAAVNELVGAGSATELNALWCVTAVAAGASDTVASEIGKAFGGVPRSFPTWHRVAPGTPGAITSIGTAAGIAAAAGIALPAFVLWLLPWPAIGPVIAGCTAGAFVESATSTAFERRGYIHNNALNVLNTAASTLVALIVWLAIGGGYSRP
jgi:uncharacterized protein (TIGR00297 family)